MTRNRWFVIIVVVVCFPIIKSVSHDVIFVESFGIPHGVFFCFKEFGMISGDFWQVDFVGKFLAKDLRLSKNIWGI